MCSFKTTEKQQHVKIPETVTETQALIGWGEDVLDKVHEVAHGIEEHVQRLLAGSLHDPSSSTCKAQASKEPADASLPLVGEGNHSIKQR